jgi:hypothetical protein
MEVENVNTIRNDQFIIKTGDVALYHTNTFLSKAIQWFERNRYSHAGIAFDSWYKLFIAEAELKGFVANDPIESFGKCEILMLRPKFEFDFKALDMFITKNLGKHPYSLWYLIPVQIVWQISSRLGHPLWIGGSRSDDKLRAAICGQITEWTWHMVTNGELFKDWKTATPASLFESDLFDHYTLEV